MIDSIDITNFRCFEHLSVGDFRPINVITGSNASGKSALLEAIYLGLNGTAQAIHNIAVQRGLPITATTPTIGFPFFPVVVPGQPQISLSLFFDNLFCSVSPSGDTPSSRPIKIKFKDREQGESSLTISYQTEGASPTPVPRIANQAATPPIVLLRQPANKPEERVIVTISPFNQLQQQPMTNSLGPPTYIFGAQANYAETDNITWFSQLRARSESDKVVSFIQEEFPFVKDLEILVPSGHNGLFAIMKDGSPPRALSTVSAGIYKVVSILLATSHTRGGVIIIDEIENGIFYKKYPAIWRVLYRFAKETGNQIFVSSHSNECLQALPDVIGDNDTDFCLIRTQMAENGSTATRISGKAMKAALAGGNEIRGIGDGRSGN
jgi:hypothetical protein